MNGKGSGRRPKQISSDEWDRRWSNIYGWRKERCPRCQQWAVVTNEAKIDGEHLMYYKICESCGASV